MKTVIYDFMHLERVRGDVVDGSDEVLRPEDRVTDEDRRSPIAGAVRRAQDKIRAARRDS